MWILKDVQFILAADQSFTQKQGALCHEAPGCRPWSASFFIPFSISSLELEIVPINRGEAVSEYTDTVWSLSDTYVNYADTFSCWIGTVLAVGKEVKYIMCTQTYNNWRLDYGDAQKSRQTGMAQKSISVFHLRKDPNRTISSGGSSVVMRNYLAPVTNFRQIIYGTIKLQGVLCSSISQMRFSLSLILAPLALAAPHLEKRLDFTSHCGQWECVK